MRYRARRAQVARVLGVWIERGKARTIPEAGDFTGNPAAIRPTASALSAGLQQCSARVCPPMLHSASETVVNAEDPFVLPLQLLTRQSLARAGGKAANLGELIRAGLPVPPGVCVTTTAYDLAAAQADLGALLEDLAAVHADDPSRQAVLAAALRARILTAPVPQPVALAVRAALATMRPDVPLAVRSSATAEDLPFASFAGQQDTFLNVVGAGAVLDALRACWASLWTDRAVAYRANNALDPRSVRLAVVLQELVNAQVAGVLFTANPLTGRRGQAVLNASPGLGEAVVSGAVDPVHFVVDTTTGAIVERRLGHHHAVPFASGRIRRQPRPARLLQRQRGPGRLPPVDAHGSAGIPADRHEPHRSLWE
ncbi:MAG: hypothetical protein LC797_24345 [Chloroflexi bacterium]|nr:hypothetical protein [Chloroflexota bacterium]